MNIDHTKTTLILGVITGMRSLSGPALLTHYLRHFSNFKLKNHKLKFVTSAGFSIISKMLAAGEIAADKTPQIPDRIKPASLSGRALSGALVGTAVYAVNRQQIWKGALIGATSAVTSAFLSFYIRKFIDTETKIPDKVLGAVEDAVVVGGGLAAVKEAH